MKRKLCCIILLCIYVLSLVPADAASFESADAFQESSLYLYSDICPENVVEYAKENFSRFVLSSIEGDVISVEDNVLLGSPFTIASRTDGINAYYFPVISNSSVIATFCICQDDGENLFGSLSQYLADELNEIAGITTSISPALLYFDNDNLMFKIGTSCDVLIADPVGKFPLGIDISYDQMMVVSPSSILETIPASQLSLSAMANSRYLSLSIIENQGKENWCGAFSAAAIVRYVTGNRIFPKAVDVMNLFYANPTDDDSITALQACQAGEYYGLAPVYRSYVLFDTAIENIDAGFPVYLRCCTFKNSDGSDDGHHAIVLRGYSYSLNTLSIWNPWDLGYTTMDMDTLMFTSGNNNFKWCSTAYNWIKK